MKKTALILGLITIAIMVIDLLYSPKYCSFSCPKNYDGIAFNWLVLFGGSFITISILYFFPSRVFSQWWKFARKAIPIIFIFSTIINLKLHHSSSSFFNMDNMFDLPILIALYLIFVIGSFWQIWKGYRGR